MKKFWGEAFRKSRNSEEKLRRKQILWVKRVQSWGGIGEKERKKETDQRHLNFPSEKKKSGKNQNSALLECRQKLKVSFGFQIPKPCSVLLKVKALQFLVNICTDYLKNRFGAGETNYIFT